MECPRCKKDIHFKERVYLNLETYKVGGSVLAVSNCCNAPFIVKMNVSYKVTPYTGNETEDEWGIKMKPFESESLNKQSK